MSQIMPEADVLFVAGFEQCESGVAAGAGGYFAARDLYPNVILGQTIPIFLILYIISIINNTQ